MSALIAIIPILLLFALMLGFKVPSHLSAFITLLVTVVLAIFVAPAMDMIPESEAGYPAAGIAGWAIVEGVLKAIFPILIIILMAIFSYNVLVASEQIEVIKRQFTSFTSDRGILVLMMVWGFGGLLEGMAGFGTAVAIPAAILIGLGFKPMFSALVALLGNTVATGFGAVGVPVTTLCNEISPGGVASAETIKEISTFTVIQLSPLFILIPFIILMLTDKKAWIRNLALAIWTGGISIGVQYACARWLGAETPAIVGSIAAILAIIVWTSVMSSRNKTTKVATPQGELSVCIEDSDTGKRKEGKAAHGFGATFKAWSVYIFILLFILLTGALCPPIEHFLKSNLVSRIQIPMIGSTFKFGWISNAGLWLFLGSIVGGLIQGLSFSRLMKILAKTTINLKNTVITICSLIALASVMNYSGMIAAIAVGLVTITGSLYPFFAPLIGAVGTFVTGSDTSSNILFAKLQASVAHQLGMTGQSACYGLGGSETNWLVASNTSGATGGKMISPQSIAIATAACDMKGKDDAILKQAIPYALLYILIAGAVVYFVC